MTRARKLYAFSRVRRTSVNFSLHVLPGCRGADHSCALLCVLRHLLTDIVTHLSKTPQLSLVTLARINCQSRTNFSWLIRELRCRSSQDS